MVISRCICLANISNHYVAPLKYIQFFLVNYTSVKLRTRLVTELNWKLGKIQARRRQDLTGTKNMPPFRATSSSSARVTVAGLSGRSVAGLQDTPSGPSPLVGILLCLCSSLSCGIRDGLVVRRICRSHVWLLTLVIKDMNPRLLSLGCLTLKEAGHCVMRALERASRSMRHETEASATSSNFQSYSEPPGKQILLP